MNIPAVVTPAVPNPQAVNRCSKCGEELPLSAFARDSRKKLGIRCSCKQCNQEYAIAWRVENSDYSKEWRAENKNYFKEWRAENKNYFKEWRMENKDKIQGYRASFRKIKKADRTEANPVIKEKTPEERASILAKNKKKHKEYQLKWVSINKEKFLEYQTEYHKKNPEIKKARDRNRRARKRNAEGSHTAADIQRLLVLQKNKCAVCHTSIANGYHVDHVMPLALGGGNGKDNLQLLCPPCNLSKNAQHPVDFMQQRGMLL